MRTSELVTREQLRSIVASLPGVDVDSAAVQAAQDRLLKTLRSAARPRTKMAASDDAGGGAAACSSAHPSQTDAIAIPLCGLTITEFESIRSSTKNGVRVATSVGVGWSKIEAWRGPACLPRTASADQLVTTVLDVGAIIDPSTTRVIKAAVWDNVLVIGGAEAGHVGKVTEFRSGLPGDGSGDIYVVESLTEGKLDARLLKRPTLGWGDAGGAPLCPGKHTLVPEPTPSDRYFCNACKKRVPAGTTMHGCRICDFDLCDKCASGNSSWPGNFLPPTLRHAGHR